MIPAAPALLITISWPTPLAEALHPIRSQARILKNRSKASVGTPRDMLPAGPEAIRAIQLSTQAETLDSFIDQRIQMTREETETKKENTHPTKKFQQKNLKLLQNI